jgi:hypothetical protein
MTKKTSPKASTPKKANAFHVFLAEYKKGKESPYMDEARKAWQTKKDKEIKIKHKEAAANK